MGMRAGWQWMGVLGALVAASMGSVGAQEICPRGVRIVVPYQPGGGTDILARHLAKSMGDDLGVSVIVDNQPGAASVRGTQLVARAQPDGCTVGVVDTAFTINAGLLPHLPFDTRTAFTPISLITTSPIILTVPVKSKYATLPDLIQAAKQAPNAIPYSSAGVGTSGHMAVEDLSRQAGIQLIHAAYKGSSQAIVDLVGGQVALAMIAPVGVMEHIRSGALRPIAVTSPARLPTLPDTPTFTELGYPKVNALVIWGLVAPAKTPPAIAARYQQIIARHVRDKDWVELGERLGMQLVASTPSDFSRFIDEDIRKWSALIKAGNIKPE